MIFLGLLFAAAAVAVTVAVVLDNTDAAQLSAFGETVPGVTSQWQVFLAGVVVAIVFMLGVTIAAFGLRRSLDLRRELRDLRDEHEESIHTLELEKQQLQRALAQARRGGQAPHAATTPHSR
ncbi:hypothetical protein ACIBF1_02415 [Spirillospora sp. NPDC050679]